MKIEIIPASLRNSFREIEQDINRVSSFTNWIQIDLCDGKFPIGDNGNKTWLPDDNFVLEKDIEGMPAWENVNYEFDLMVIDYAKYIELAKDLGALRIVGHIDNLDDIKKASRLCRGYDIEFGLSTTNIELIKESIDLELVDYIQVMGIEHIGKQGQPFYDKVFNDIKEIRKIIDTNIEKRKQEIQNSQNNLPEEYKKFLKNEVRDMPIQIDGAMRPETIELCKNAGAIRFAVGSYLFKSHDIGETYKNLKRI